MSYTQAILLPADTKLTSHDIMTGVAKASMSLMTRCFEGAEAFLGKHENKQFQQVVIEWIEKDDQRIDMYSVPDSGFCDTYFFTAEIQGIPSKHIYNQTKQHVCTVIGPATDEELAELLIGCTPYDK